MYLFAILSASLPTNPLRDDTLLSSFIFSTMINATGIRTNEKESVGVEFDNIQVSVELIRITEMLKFLLFQANQ